MLTLSRPEPPAGDGARPCFPQLKEWSPARPRAVEVTVCLPTLYSLKLRLEKALEDLRQGRLDAACANLERAKGTVEVMAGAVDGGGGK